MAQGLVGTRHGCVHYVEEGLPDCVHFPMIDDPVLFANEVDRLIRQVSQ